jgi:simple sugar transport system substrate-binding protein
VPQRLAFLDLTMNLTQRRHLHWLARASAVSATVSVAALALTACGKTEAPTSPTVAPASAPTDAGSAPASAAQPASAASSAGGAPMKVAFAYIGPVGDGGWSFAHDNARKAVEQEFAGRITTSYVESVSDTADAERVLRDMASNNQMVFGTTFGYMQAMQKVAADFPNVKFEHATGYKTAPNLSTYDSRTYEGAYLAGVVAGSMTTSNTLGVVGSVPIPEVLRNINSFTLGAQSVNPKITTKVVWANDWFNPPKETEAATALINGGADILFQNTDSSAVLQTAEKMGKRGFGWDSDMSAYGPKAHLGSAVIHWQPYYRKVIGDALAGKWQSGQSWWGVKEGAVDLVSLAADVPEAARAKVDEVKAGLKAGSYVIWKGPISDNAGKVMVAEGTTADDNFLRNINFFVKGVEGKVPGAK